MMASIPRTASPSFFGVPNMAGLFSRGAARQHAKVDRELEAARSARVEPTMKVVAKTQAPAAYNVEKILAAARKAPQLSAIEWDGDGRAAENEFAFDASFASPAADGVALDARCQKIRDRYISARFPGVVRSSTDLENAELVIKSARLFYEDGQVDLAHELLDLAIDGNPRAEAMRLAQLELLFLARDCVRYPECAVAFRAAHPASDAWAEIKRLGQAMCPDSPLFGAASGPREHDHYGPWPHLPNWIQASWDLTAECVAADFHRAVTRNPSFKFAA
jgi:hypothetical protein